MVNTSLFIFSDTLPTLKLPIKSLPPSRIFSDVVLVSNYHGCKGEAVKLIPYYMIDIILQNCKATTFENIANHTKHKKPNAPSYLHIFWLNFDKVTHSFLHPSRLLGETEFSTECCVGVISFCLGRDDENLGASFEWGGAWVKMSRISAFSRNVNSINLKIFPTLGRI